MELDAIHTRIKQARISTGLTQVALAEALGVGRTTYIAFESGRTRLYKDIVDKLARFYHTTPEEFLYGRRMDERLLRDQASLDEWKRAIVDDYENRLADVREKLSAALETIKKQDETIRQNEETIHYLLKELREKD